MPALHKVGLHANWLRAIQTHVKMIVFVPSADIYIIVPVNQVGKVLKYFLEASL